MLGIHVHTNPAKASAYFREHLVNDSAASEYYSQHQQTPGQWIGEGAKRLGLQGDASMEHFERLCHNCYPLTGNRLTARNNPNARSGYDFVFSAPKSLSVMALPLDDPRIIEAHEAAVAETLRELEAFAMSRVRTANANSNRITGNFVGVSFTHFTSRESDPQLHTHCHIFNATYDDAEGRWKALQAVELFARSGLMAEVYRNRLVARLRAIGYQTRDTKEAFEIEGVSREDINPFSKRHRQIDDAVEDLGSSNKNKALRAALAQTTRKAKDTSLSLPELRQRWLKELPPERIAALQALKDAATAPVAPTRKVTIAQALEGAALHLFERLSEVPAHVFVKETMALCRGQHDMHSICQRLEKDPRFALRNGHVTTPDILAAEEAMIASAQANAGTLPPLNECFAASPKLSDEQNTAVQMLLRCRDAVSVLDGGAGVGKSRTLQTLVTGLHAAGHDVLMCAPTSGATEVLRKDGFIGAMTLQRLLTDRDRQKELDGAVIILDEAGLVSTAQMLDLLTLSTGDHRCRLILSGDTQQLNSVEAGDAMRILQEHGTLTRASLHTIRRQEHDGYRSAVQDILDGKGVEGFDALDKLGWVHEVPEDEERYKALASHYRAAVLNNTSPTDIPALAVVSTWREVFHVTTAIRSDLQDHGLVSTAERIVSVLDPLHLTLAQRKQLAQYEPGQVIAFQRKAKPFERGQHLTVMGVTADGLVMARNEKGEDCLVDPLKHAKQFSVFSPRKIAVAHGDQLLLRSNGLSGDSIPRRLVNGELVTVDKIDSSGRITLKDGRSLPKEFQHFTHGYAVTAQSAQGKSVNTVLVAIDAVSALTAATFQGLYVAISRGKKRCAIFTDCKDLVADAFLRSSERLAALELLQSAPLPITPNSTQNENDNSTQPPHDPNSPGRSLRPTGLAPCLQSFDFADRGQADRRRTDPLLRAQYLGKVRRNREHPPQVQQPVCKLPEVRRQLPLPSLERAGYR
jgi:conjugative relaxase-like TrwC/TraI family protein